MKFFVLVVLSIIIAGCATDPAAKITADLTDPAEEAVSGPTPLGVALDRIQNNPILTTGDKWSIETLAKIDTWHGKISASDEFDARQCPSRILLGNKNIRARVEKAKVLVTGIESAIKGLDASFNPLLMMTVRKWGPPDEIGADQKAELEATKEDILKDVRGIQRACANVIPDRDVVRLLEQAAGLMK